MGRANVDAAGQSSLRFGPSCFTVRRSHVALDGPAFAPGGRALAVNFYSIDGSPVAEAEFLSRLQEALQVPAG